MLNEFIKSICPNAKNIYLHISKKTKMTTICSTPCFPEIEYFPIQGYTSSSIKKTESVSILKG